MIPGLDKLLGSVSGGGLLGFLGPVGLLTGIASLASGKKSIGEAARDAVLGGAAGKFLGIGSLGDASNLLTGSGKEAVAKVTSATAGEAATTKGIQGLIERAKKEPLKAATQAMTLAGLYGALTESPEGQQAFTAADMETLPDYEGQVYKGSMDPSKRTYTNPIYAAQGGFIQGPGTPTSDSINAGIFQNGRKVQEAKLSDGEFVMKADAVKGLGNGDRAKGAAKMYALQNQFSRMS